MSPRKQEKWTRQEEIQFWPQTDRKTQGQVQVLSRAFAAKNLNRFKAVVIVRKYNLIHSVALQIKIAKKFNFLKLTSVGLYKLLEKVIRLFLKQGPI